MTDNTSDEFSEQVQEWMATLEFICRSPEVRELMHRLEVEDHAYPQTVVKIEEE